MGHEGHLHERADAERQQPVVQGIDVLPVVDRLAVDVLAVGAHVVVQEAVHADVVESDLALHQGQLFLPVGAETFVGASGADALSEDGVVRALYPGKTNPNGPVRLAAERNRSDSDKQYEPWVGHDSCHFQHNLSVDVHEYCLASSFA